MTSHHQCCASTVSTLFPHCILQAEFWRCLHLLFTLSLTATVVDYSFELMVRMSYNSMSKNPNYPFQIQYYHKQFCSLIITRTLTIPQKWLQQYKEYSKNGRPTKKLLVLHYSQNINCFPKKDILYCCSHFCYTHPYSTNTTAKITFEQ